MARFAFLRPFGAGPHAAAAFIGLDTAARFRRELAEETNLERRAYLAEFVRGSLRWARKCADNPRARRRLP